MQTLGEESAAFLRESDRVAESPLAMEDHPGHRLLRGAVLPGGSARTLTGPVVERVTLRALVARMKSEYEQVTVVLADAREAWSWLDALDSVAGGLAGVESPAARRLRAEIAGAHPPVPGEDVAGALDGLRGRFPDVAESDLAAVEAAVGAALARAREVAAHLDGSLDRRAELRGRLDAYRAKAAGRGFAEDAELSALHRRARDALFSAPCDLNAGTVAVRRYQRAVLARTEGR